MYVCVCVCVGIKPFLTLFLRDAILFENFLLDTSESQFTHNVVLPTIKTIATEIGIKPLIVALEPTEVEGDEFWLSYPHKDRVFVDRKKQDKAAIIQTI